MHDFATITTDLRSLPPRFHLDPGVAGQADTLHDLIADPARLTGWLNQDAARVGAPDGAVAASMLVQHVAMILGGGVFAAALLNGVLPCAPSDRIQITPGGPTRWKFALVEPDLITGTEDELMQVWVDFWIDGILMELVDAIRGVQRVGLRMLRDNVATGAGSTLVFFDWWDPQRDLGRLADPLTAAGAPPLGDSFTFERIEHDGHLGLHSLRRSCCLHTQTDPPHHCPTCPKIDAAEREEIMRTHLGHLDIVRAGGTIRPLQEQTH